MAIAPLLNNCYNINMKDVDISDLISIIKNQNRLIKYYSILWFLSGMMIGIIGLCILAFIFGNK